LRQAPTPLPALATIRVAAAPPQSPGIIVPRIIVEVPVGCVADAGGVLPETGAGDATTTTVLIGAALATAGTLLHTAVRRRGRTSD
jgi:LPXTG-motif cell wall-anchored protein